jgi:hypothetical protein
MARDWCSLSIFPAVVGDLGLVSRRVMPFSRQIRSNSISAGRGLPNRPQRDGGVCPRPGRRLMPRPFGRKPSGRGWPSPGGCPRYRRAGGGPPLRRPPAPRQPISMSWPVLRAAIVSPCKITVRALPPIASGGGAQTAPPLTLISYGKTLGTYRKDGPKRRAPFFASALRFQYIVLVRRYR